MVSNTKTEAKVSKRTISEVLADNLGYFMREKKFTQKALGERAGVAQRTIGNYLNSELRPNTERKSGKPASPKLVEVEKIATALGIEVWELLRPLTPAERKFYRQIEESFNQLRNMAALQTPDMEEPPPDRQRGEAATHDEHQ